MPYQEYHISEPSEPDPALGQPGKRSADENNARTIQIMIAVGLVLAIIVAVFGSY